ncbi:MAG: hypothetical protein V2A54_03575 [Bacteroidota bacterium]
MKYNIRITFSFLVLFILISQFSFSQNTKKDSLKTISTIGIFDGKIVTVGNFHTERVYKINDFCISPNDMTQSKVDSLKGKKICVTGILKIKEGQYGPTKSSNDGTIYEPYKEPDKKFIANPKFTIVYDSREPLIKK